MPVMKALYVLTMTEIIQTNPDVVAGVIEKLPEFPYKTTAIEIADRSTKNNALLLLAREKDQDAGFLVAFPITESIYYNWIMGVLPPFRRQGISKMLMDEFERYSLKYGCAKCLVKTMNRYRNTLRLLINRNYNIIGFDGSKIAFEKEII
jgi:GNAT superfamily N-acetyltransferase